MYFTALAEILDNQKVVCSHFWHGLNMLCTNFFIKFKATYQSIQGSEKKSAILDSSHVIR